MSDSLINILDEALRTPKLSEEWYQNFMRILIKLDAENRKKAEEYLGNGSKVIKNLLLSCITTGDTYIAPEELFKKLAESGSRIQAVHGAFVMTDNDETLVVKPGSGTMSNIEFAPKTVKIIAALIQNNIFADDIIVYRGGVMTGMARTAPYTVIDIPRINRQIAVCDEIGETTFWTTNRLPPYIWADSSKKTLKAMDDVNVFRYSRDSSWGIDLLAEVLGINTENRINPLDTAKVPLPRKASNPILTKEKIIEWVKAFHAYKGYYPTTADTEVYERDRNGGFVIMKGENWVNLNNLLTNGDRGLKGKTTLLKLRKEYSLTTDLSNEKIIEWIKIFHEHKGWYPTTGDTEIFERDAKGGFAVVHNENWPSINMQLTIGGRGLKKKGSSLLKLRQKHGLVEESITEEKIVMWVKTFNEHKGKYPSALDENVFERDGKGGFVKVEGENWNNIDNALRDGFRGFSKGLSLAKLKKKHGLVNNLTIEQIKEWINIFVEHKGRFPTECDSEVFERNGKGGFVVVEGEKWVNISHSLKLGRRGLSAGGPLFADLKEQCGDINILPKDKIIEWLKNFKEHIGWYPTDRDKDVFEKDAEGNFTKVPNENWKGIAEALRKGFRGWEKGSSLAEIKREHGLINENNIKRKVWVRAAKKASDVSHCLN